MSFREPQRGPVDGKPAAYVKDSGLETTERNTIKTDQNMMTNLTGVFAAGDASLSWSGQLAKAAMWHGRSRPRRRRGQRDASCHETE